MKKLWFDDPKRGPVEVEFADIDVPHALQFPEWSEAKPAPAPEAEEDNEEDEQ